MKTVTLGNTGITVNRNGFGALPIQRISVEEAGKLLRKAYDNGIRFFDTARAYSDSEYKIGQALADVRDDIIIATKTASTTVEGFWKDLETSLSMLKTDHVDIYQFHTPSFCPKPGDGTGLYEAMLEAKAQGKIRHIGITNHRLHVAREAVESGLYETLQFPFCYLASEKDIELVNLCKEKNVGFICMKALSGGLITRSDAAYAYLAQYENTLPIWGVQREKELDEFLSYNDNPPVMTDELAAFIEKEHESLAGDFCRGCGYCMPCPKGINIPGCFAAYNASYAHSWFTGLSQYFTASAVRTSEAKLVSNCVKCGKCARHCPQHIDIPERLDDVRRRFQPGPVTAVLKAFGKTRSS